MDAFGVKQFQSALETRFRDLGIETALVDGGENQVGGTLRALLPVTDDGDMSLMEFMVTDFDGDTQLLFFYSTLIVEIGPGCEALQDVLLDWNLLCPLGAFGIYRQERQFYHKYALPFPPDTDPAALADRAAELAEMLSLVIGQRFPEAVRLSGHA